MLPVICLQPQAGEAVLDLTAAPGSKSSQIASLMQNQGSLTAIELDYIRCQRLTHNLNLLGVDLVNYCQVHQMDALQYLAKYPKQYDKILLDAPCTSSARIIADQKKTYTHKSLHQSLKFSKLQLKLLTAAFTQLKTGGKLVYSTCSLHPAENHFVVQAFLKSQAAAQLKQVEFKNLKKISYNIDVDPQILTKTFQVMPDKFIESFYIASITRKHA